MNKIFVLLTFLVSVSIVNCARILFVAGTPSYSHQIIFQPIWRELSLRGHQVTVITSNPLKDPKLTNLTELDMSFLYTLVESKYKFSATIDKIKNDPVKFGQFFIQALSSAHEEQLSHPLVHKLINDPNEKFDLVIAEFLLPTMLAFGHRFGCPTIAVTSLDITLAAHDAIGNPTHPVLYPDFVLRFSAPRGFTDRLVSTLYSILRRMLTYYVGRSEDKVILKHFGEGYPMATELTRRVDLFFANVNLGFHNIRPTVPGFVYIGGGMHIKEEKPLPENLKKFLDEAENGVVYLSFGTNVRTKTLTPEFLQVLLATFSELPYKVLWKLDEESLAEMSDNILIQKWVPQQDVLRHPKVKAFITQCGLQSVEEAINFHVPLVGVPFCADQFSNCMQVERKGMGIIVDHHTVDKKTLKSIIVEVISNATYKQNVEKVARISADEPMTGLQKAVWWTEYVIRHKGAKHLKGGAADLPFYQYFLLDVIAFLVVVLSAFAYILVKLIKFCCCIVKKYRGKNCKTENKTKVKSQ